VTVPGVSVWTVISLLLVEACGLWGPAEEGGRKYLPEAPEGAGQRLRKVPAKGP
jgi:hypothetical protein